MTTGFVLWIYTWLLIRGIRNEYAAGDLGKMPPWLPILMALASTALIATVVMAGLRVEVWGLLAMVAVAAYIALVFLGQMSIMRGLSEIAQPTLGDAARAAVRVRGPILSALFIGGLPAALFLSGLSRILERNSPPKSYA